MAGLVTLVCCGIATLAWFGYRATVEWNRSSSLLVEQRTSEVADLLVTAVRRDMRAVQRTVLDGRDWDAASLRTPSDIIDLVAGAFARYPYADSFFAIGPRPDDTAFFARSDRVPKWLRPTNAGGRYPVEVLASPDSASLIYPTIEHDLRLRRQYSTFEIRIDGTPYQVVARMLYAEGTREHVIGVFGFLVDLDWVRTHYFETIIEQVTRIAGANELVEWDIVDQSQTSVLQRPALESSATVVSRPFALAFFDPTIVATAPEASPQTWAIRISGAKDPTLTSAARGARRTLVLVGTAALLAGLGLMFTVRAAKAAGDVAAMRSDFVSSVTHALKTPVAVIKGIGETMIRGRVSTPEHVHDYAQLLVQEGHRLSRLVDNLLAYAQVTDEAELYSFEPQRPADLVTSAIRNVRRLISDQGFDLRVDVSDDLPLVAADRTALLLALDNLIDNAIRYSGGAKTLVIAARASTSEVEFDIIDRGNGIRPEQLRAVRRRFVREGSSDGHGTGLGLAIVNRIAHDHGGRLQIHSAIGSGTTATLAIPIVQG